MVNKTMIQDNKIFCVSVIKIFFYESLSMVIYENMNVVIIIQEIKSSRIAILGLFSMKGEQKVCCACLEHLNQANHIAEGHKGRQLCRPVRASFILIHLAEL